MITPERLDRIAAAVRRVGLSDQTLSLLRETCTDLHFTWCHEDDVSVGEPVRRGEGFALYLVDGRGHCLALTTDPEAATGVLLATVED